MSLRQEMSRKAITEELSEKELNKARPEFPRAAELRF
jgi:hypothetical protein